MKTARFIFSFIMMSWLLSACSVFQKNKQGCGDNGKNVGAEKLLDGSYEKKQPKFKS